MSTSAPRGTGELSLRARPHLASTACALRQQPASTPCVNTVRLSCVNTLRQHPASTAGVHRCPKLTPVPNRRFPDLQPIYKVARNCSGKGEALWSNFRLPVGDSPRHLCQHPASTPCVNSRSQHPASTPCVNTVLFPGPTTKEILNFLCSRGPLQRKSSISFVPRAHYKGNLQFPLFPGHHPASTPCVNSRSP